MKKRKEKKKNIEKENNKRKGILSSTNHLEKRLRNLETKKQLLDAERLKLEQEVHSLRYEIDRLRDTNGRKSPISRLMQLVPVNIRNLFGEILEKLMLIMLNTQDLGEQNLRDVKSGFSTLLEEIEALRKMIQEPRKKLLKWYELRSVKAEQPPGINNQIKKEEKVKSDYVFKIIVLGNPEKTAFILKFVAGIFMEDIRNRAGVDFYTKILEVEGKTVTLRIWDFAAEERFRFLLHQYIKDANGAIIMYDAIDIKILKIISELLEIIKKNVADIPIFFAIPELPSKAEELVDLIEKYTLTEITSETGPTGEHAFELLTKKMFEHEHIE